MVDPQLRCAVMHTVQDSNRGCASPEIMPGSIRIRSRRDSEAGIVCHSCFFWLVGIQLVVFGNVPRWAEIYWVVAPLIAVPQISLQTELVFADFPHTRRRNVQID